MSEEKDTVVQPTETESPQDNGTVEEPQVDVPVTTEEQDKIDRETYEQLQKELNKTKQELNLRRNQEKELERKRLEESGEFKELADKLQAELDEIRAKQEQEAQRKEAEDFRKGILGQYSKEVQEAAEELNLWWDDPQDFSDAEAQLKAKIDVLAARIGTRPAQEDQETGPEISANNPAVDIPVDPEIAQLQSMSAEDLRKILPKADPR